MESSVREVLLQCIDKRKSCQKQYVEVRSCKDKKQKKELKKKYIQSLEEIIAKLTDVQANSEKEKHLVLYLLALTKFNKGKILGRKRSEYESLIESALQLVETASKCNIESSSTHSLWGQILAEVAKNHGNNGNKTDNENFLAHSIEQLLKALELNPKHLLSYKLLQQTLEELTNSNKQRQRTGKAIYHIAGEMVKQGGSYKSWKTRWFVVDDSSIAYYKNKSEWESGPVMGLPAKPQGSIYFNDVLAITGQEDDNTKYTNTASSKGKKDEIVLHILTHERTFNVKGFPSLRDHQDWVATLRRVLRLYNAKKRAKKAIKEHSSNNVETEIWQLESMLEVDEAKVEAFTAGSSGMKTPLSPSTSRRITNSSNEPKFTVPAGKFRAQFITEEPSTELTFDRLLSTLRDVDEEDALEYTKALLQQFEREGNLVALITNLVREDPKQFLQNVCDIADFHIAKFGGLKKLDKIIDPQEELVDE